MIAGIDLEQVKQYNSSLKTYKDKSAQLTAEINFNQTELIRLCNELSNELGTPVTPDNIEQIYTERITKIQDTLSAGTEILNRIRQEETQAYN